MKLKLYRFYNILNPSFIISFTVLIVILSLFSILKNFRWDFIVSEVVVVLIYMFLFSLNYPKYIELKVNGINYIAPTLLTPKHGIGYKNVNVNYHITDITKFELQQNKIERLLGVAHVIFQGKTTFDAGKHTDKISPKNIHRVYGISIKKHNQVISDFVGNLNLGKTGDGSVPW